MHNFGVLADAGGPRRFFEEVASRKGTTARVQFLSKTLKYYKKKGCRDILIELRLASDCMAVDQRIRRILEATGVRLRRSVDSQYDQIESELIVKIAKPNHLTGGELDRVLFQNAADIMVRLLCP